MAEIALRAASVTFKVKTGAPISLKDFLVQGRFLEGRKQVREVKALQGISLKFGQGDRIGIIGHNGAGKSTLLRVLAGVYPPTSGRVRIRGRVSSLFDINLGFEPDESGWRNIIYRGYLQGETPSSISARIADVAEFSELGDALSMPVRHYSSGMLVRLAFSIATAVDPEILLVDEALGAGDLAFLQKAQERIRKVVEMAKLVVMVSHDLAAIAKYCSRVVWVDHGQVRLDGDPSTVITRYMESAQRPNNAAA